MVEADLDTAGRSGVDENPFVTVGLAGVFGVAAAGVLVGCAVVFVEGPGAKVGWLDGCSDQVGFTDP